MTSMIFVNDLYLICFVVAFLYIWLDTDALVEWAKLFHFRFLYAGFDENKKSPVPMVASRTYPDYLLYAYGWNPIGAPWWKGITAFFLHGITCPVCFSVWLNCIALGVFYDRIGGIQVLGFNILAVWLLYPLVQKVTGSPNA